MSGHPVRDEILALLEPGDRPLWHGGPTFDGVLDGVGAEMASWQPGAGRHTIWALSLHMAYWKYAVRRRIMGLPEDGFPRSPDNFPELVHPLTEEDWSRDRALCEQENDALIALVKTLEETRLQEPCPGDYRVADQLFGIAMHDAHHVAQILLIKRWWEDLHGIHG